jgi:hypothetical protein
MSDNPFEQPTVAPTNESYPTGPVSFPTAVMVICILCLILGLFGLFSACAGGIGIAAAESVTQLMPAEAREDFQKQMDLNFLPLVFQTVVGAIFAPLMVVASIGCLIRKPWGRSLLVIAAVGFVVWNLVGIGFAVWMTIFHIDLLASPNVPVMGQDGATQMAYATQIFSIVLAAVFMCFYVFAAMYMNRKSVKDFFAGQTA